MLFNALAFLSRNLLFVVTIISFFNIKKFGKLPLKLFPFYLLYISLVELIGHQIALSGMKYNIWWYNIMLNGQYLFLFYFYFKLIKNKKVKKGLIALSVFYITFFIYQYLIINDDWNKYQSYPFFLGNMIVIFSVFWYLIELFQSDEVLYLKNIFTFWISLGLLFQFILIVPYDFISIDFINAKFENNPTVKLFSAVLYFANILFYALFLNGLWNTKTLK